MNKYGAVGRILRVEIIARSAENISSQQVRGLTVLGQAVNQRRLSYFPHDFDAATTSEQQPRSCVCCQNINMASVFSFALSLEFEAWLQKNYSSAVLPTLVFFSRDFGIFLI